MTLLKSRREVPGELRKRIVSITDSEQLKQLFNVALTSDSVDEFVFKAKLESRDEKLLLTNRRK